MSYNELQKSNLTFTPNVEFKLLPISELISNQPYQRALSIKHVNETVNNFDMGQINPIKVSFRNGKYYVLNGQHTMEAVATASGSRDTLVWCMIYDNLEYEREADIFANQMKFTKNLRPIEVFNAKIEAGDSVALSIKALLDSYNLTLAEKVHTRTIGAISTVEEIYNKYGYDILDHTLFLIIKTWEGEYKSFTSNFLRAVSRIIYCYGEEIKDNIFVDKLGCISINEICRSSMERRSGSIGYAETLLTFYNKKSQTPLHITKLYKR